MTTALPCKSSLRSFDEGCEKPLPLSRELDASDNAFKGTMKGTYGPLTWMTSVYENPVLAHEIQKSTVGRTNRNACRREWSYLDNYKHFFHGRGS